MPARLWPGPTPRVMHLFTFYLARTASSAPLSSRKLNGGVCRGDGHPEWADNELFRDFASRAKYWDALKTVDDRMTMQFTERGNLPAESGKSCAAWWRSFRSSGPSG